MFVGLAHLVFWVALLVGALSGELRLRAAAIFAALWLAGYVGAGRVVAGGFLFASYAAVLAVVLVLKVFGGDVRLR